MRTAITAVIAALALAAAAVGLIVGASRPGTARYDDAVMVMAAESPAPQRI